MQRSSSITRAAARAALLCPLLALVPTPAARADDRARAVRLAEEGRCDAALPGLDAARLAAPADAELALLAGRCRLRLRRYPEAARDLELAARLAPDRAEVWLALARARYHAGDLPGAQAALDCAAPGAPDDPDLWLYAGMLALERGESEAAARSLTRARSLDPERVEPVASYYLGLAHAQARDVEAARPELERVSDVWRGTDWSTRAEQELRRLRSATARHAWLSAGAGLERDSNVVLRGRGVSLPEDISDDDDWRGVWTANAGVELWKNASATLGAMTSYRGTTHFELSEFDAHFPSVTTWLDADLDESTRATARYDFGYAWLHGDPFVATNTWQLSFAHAWPRLGSTEVYGGAILDDYFFDSEDVPDTCTPTTLCGPPGIDERSARRRSGYGFSAGLGHTLPLATGDLPVADAALRGGYEFGSFESRGREYSHDSHEVLLGLSMRLPLEIDFDASGSFAYQPYRHPTSYPDPPVASGAPYALSGKDRVDQVYGVQASLARSLTDVLSVSASWRFTDNRSNAEVFDYERHVIGIYFTLGLGREL